MFEFNVSKDMQKKNIIKKMILRKITAHLCLTLIVEQVRVVPNNTKYNQTLHALNGVDQGPTFSMKNRNKNKNKIHVLVETQNYLEAMTPPFVTTTWLRYELTANRRVPFRSRIQVPHFLLLLLLVPYNKER